MLVAFALAAGGTAGYLGGLLTSSIPETKPKKPVYGTQKDFEKAIKELRATFESSDAVSTLPEDLHDHGFSMYDYHPGVSRFKAFTSTQIDSSVLGTPHTVIVYPSSTEDVAKVVRIATKYRMPVVPYGGATSLEGGCRGVGPVTLLMRSCFS